jgi:hypothetical protein
MLRSERRILLVKSLKIRVCEGCEQIFDGNQRDSLEPQRVEAHVIVEAEAESDIPQQIEGYCPSCAKLMRMARRYRTGSESEAGTA